MSRRNGTLGFLGHGGSPRSRFVALLAAALAVALLAPGAQADPDGDGTPTRQDVREARRAAERATDDVAGIEAALDRANARLDAAGEAAGQAAEAYNGARWRLREAKAALVDARSEARRTTRRLDEQRSTYRRTLISTVGTGVDLSSFTAVLDADGVSSLLGDTAAVERVQAKLEAQRLDYFDAADEAADAEDVAEDAETSAADAAAAALETRDAAAVAAQSATDAATAIAAKKTRLIKRLAKLEGVAVSLVEQRRAAAEEKARLKAEEQAKKEAEEQAKEQAEDDAAPADVPADNPSDDAPPTTPPNTEPNDEPDDEPDTQPGDRGVAAAIAFARAQIGEPYVWGAAGPNSWDCSGLTMAAWRAGGRSLPHYSVAQYSASTPISYNQLRPGDLAFWGSSSSPSSIYHVALYIGNGRMIHAPRTGRDVTEESLFYWRPPNFYARP